MGAYGAILKEDGRFVNKNGNEFMEYYGLGIPGYVYYKGVPTDFEDEMHVYIGCNKIYGSWIGIYRTQIWLIDDCNVTRVLDVHDDIFSKIEDNDTIVRALPGMSSIYISKLSGIKGDTYRYYLGVDAFVGNKGIEKKKHYECIFGYGVTCKEDEWRRNRNRKEYGYFDNEITEIDAWFA